MNNLIKYFPNHIFSFHRGPVHVMTTAFQHPYLVNKNGVHPSILGPVFYLENRKQKTISDFDYALKQEWGDINMIFGSDEEQGMRNSAKDQFPYSLGVLCTLHLEDNTKRKMAENKVKKEDQNR